MDNRWTQALRARRLRFAESAIWRCRDLAVLCHRIVCPVTSCLKILQCCGRLWRLEVNIAEGDGTRMRVSFISYPWLR